MSKDDKFARVAALRPTRKSETPASGLTATRVAGDQLAELLGARISRNHSGEHLSLQRWYATPEKRLPDARSLSLLLPQPPESERWLSAATDPEQWLFLDTETTGLAGGTGTYAFLVGIAWWESGGLQVEQFFMRDLDEEHSLLLELSKRMKQRPILVTFNGKSFDWPLLETRYQMTRSIPASPPKLHLDLLHPARQIWRLRLGSVRLKDLERHVLGEGGRSLDWSRQDDIDSSLIPQLYFDFLHGGPAEPLAGICRHNRMDLRGLAALAGRIFSLLDAGIGIAHDASAGIHDPIEVLGLSRLLRERGRTARAREFYESALRFGLPGTMERLAQRELAQLAKRELDYARAISLWNALRQPFMPSTHSDSPFLAKDSQTAVETAIEAAEQLAIYYEHRMKQPRRALELVRAAIAEFRGAQLAGKLARERAVKIEARLSRRFARLERRCERALPFGHAPDGNQSIDTPA